MGTGTSGRHDPTRRAGALLAVLTLASALAAACGGSTEGGGSSGPIALPNLPDAIAAAECDGLAPCCSSANIPLDPVTCRATLSSLSRDSISRADPARYVYDANAAGACVSEARAAFSSCQPPASSQIAACQQTFQGRVAEGGACNTGIECAKPGNGSTASCTGGVCVVDRRGIAGDPCYWSCHEDGSSRSCSGTGAGEAPGQSRCYDNDGLYCTSTGTCAAQKQNGAQCGGDHECTSGRCDFTTGTCAPLATAGQSCFVDSDCATGLYCGGSTCAQAKPQGASCTFDRECQSVYCNAAQCASTPSGGTSVATLCVVANGGQP